MLHEMQVMKPEYFGTQNYAAKKQVPKMVPIAPAINRKTLTVDLDLNKRKYTSKSNPYSGAQASSIARRNARERNRVQQVNDGFNALRKRLPAAVVSALSGGSRRGSGKKLSKVDTLRMVVEYIRYLENLVDDNDEPLGYTNECRTTSPDMKTSIPQDIDEGIFAGRLSPYSETALSPAGSECSSGISSINSSAAGSFVNNIQYHQENQSPMPEEDLFDAISWWQNRN